MMLASCSSDDDELVSDGNKPAEGEMITIGVGIDAGTRVDINDLKLTWHENDQIYVIGYGNDGSCKGQQLYNIDNASIRGDKKIAKFTGTFIEADKYSVVCKAKNVNVDGKGKYSVDYSNADGSEADLKNFLLIARDDIKDLKSGIRLNMKNSFAKVEVHSLPSDLTSVSQIRWYVDFRGEKEHLQSVVKFAAPKNVSDLKYVYMPFEVGHNLSAGGTVAFQFVGNEFKAVTAKSKGKEYLAGKRYNFKVAADAGTDDALNTWNSPEESITNDVLLIKTTKDEWESIPISELNTALDPNYKATIKEVYVPSSLFHLHTIVGPTPAIEGMFRECDNLLKAVLAEGVEEIGNFAFYRCHELKEVLLPSTVTTIRTNAFARCWVLESLVVPKNVKIIETDAFNGTKLLSLALLCPKTADTKFSSKLFQLNNADHPDPTQCDLRINSTFKDEISGNVWTVNKGREDERAYTFKSITLVNENNEVVK